MNSPRVWNKRDRHAPDSAVYIGRPGKWGNPFSDRPGTLARHQCGSREEALARYRQWLNDIFARDPAALDRLRAELGGKDLVCWCKPAACHGDVLLELANAPPRDDGGAGRGRGGILDGDGK